MNFYRHFIHHYSNITLLLTALTTKKSKEAFTGLTNTTKQVFNDLKLAFTMAPDLQHFNQFLPPMLITDASDYAFASILFQPDKENLLHPVTYYSKKFAPQEINYEIHNKELLAIINSFWDMRLWSIGSSLPISVISNHKNLWPLKFLIADKLADLCSSHNLISNWITHLAKRILPMHLQDILIMSLKREMKWWNFKINHYLPIIIWISYSLVFTLWHLHLHKSCLWPCSWSTIQNY